MHNNNHSIFVDFVFLYIKIDGFFQRIKIILIRSESLKSVLFKTEITTFTAKYPVKLWPSLRQNIREAGGNETGRFNVTARCAHRDTCSVRISPPKWGAFFALNELICCWLVLDFSKYNALPKSKSHKLYTDRKVIYYSIDSFLQNHNKIKLCKDHWPTCQLQYPSLGYRLTLC